MKSSIQIIPILILFRNYLFFSPTWNVQKQYVSYDVRFWQNAKNEHYFKMTISCAYMVYFYAKLDEIICYNDRKRQHILLTSFRSLEQIISLLFSKEWRIIVKYMWCFIHRKVLVFFEHFKSLIRDFIQISFFRMPIYPISNIMTSKWS